MDVASSFILKYGLSFLELLIEDPPEGHALLECVSLSTVVRAVLCVFFVCLRWHLLDNGSYMIESFAHCFSSSGLVFAMRKKCLGLV